MVINFGGKPLVVVHQSPNDISVNAVKCLVKVNEDCIYAYRGVCHFSDYSMMMRIVTMWSVHERSWRKPACSSRSRLSRVVFSLSNIILVITLPGMDSNIMPRQLPQDDRSPFLGSFNGCPFSSLPALSPPPRSCLRVDATCLSRPGCRASGGMPSGPAAFPDFSDLMALAISALLGGLVLMSRSSDGGWMSGGAGLLSVPPILLSAPHIVFPFSSLTGQLGLLFFPKRVLVIL